MTFSVIVDDRDAQAMLSRLVASAQDQTELMGQVGWAWQQLAETAFDTQTDPWGMPWDELRPSTIALRRQGSSLPLNDIGLLRASVEYSADAGGVSVSVGRADRPAAVHQFGNPDNLMFGRGFAPIPPRPFLPITEAGEVRLEGTEYLEVLQDLVEAGWAEVAA